MTPAEFRAALEGLGLNQTTAAPVLGVDVRTVRRYAAEPGCATHRPVPATVVKLLEALAARDAAYSEGYLAGAQFG